MKKLILVITLWAILIHILLIALTVLEVYIYSTFINSGQPLMVYQSHAQKSGPYIGIVIGFILIYWVTGRLIKKNATAKKLIWLGLPLGYAILDLVILLISGTDILNNLWVFALSFATKFLAGYFALKMTRN